MAWSYGLLGTCGSICYEVLSDVGLTGLQAYVMERKDTLLRCEKCCLGNWDNEFHKVRGEGLSLWEWIGGGDGGGGRMRGVVVWARL